MAFELPGEVYSPQLLEAVLYDLRTYLAWYRQNDTRKRVGAPGEEEPTHSAETALVIERWLDGRTATLEELQELLGYLEKLNLPQVHLTLAALPNRAQREVLVEWFHINISPHLLVSFTADRNVGGGITVRTPNRVFDYTWSQQLLEGRASLAGIIKHV